MSNIDPKALRNALGSFTTGVTIITTQDQSGQAVGLTANSFNSVSLDPPLVLWSLAKNALSVPAFTAAEHWNVHVLSAGQQDLSNRFAARGEDKFAGVELEQGLNNAPLIANCCARFQCKTAFTHDGGDHIIFIGEVLDFDHSALPPLAFQGGQYALTASKPWQEVSLSQNPDPLDCSYNEDLLGYLLGRAHFQMLGRLSPLLQKQRLQANQFYALSTFAIAGHLSLSALNEYLGFTGHQLSETELAELLELGLLETTGDQHSTHYRLSANGQQASLAQIARAKANEEELVEHLGQGDINALKLLLKRMIHHTDPGVADLWAKEEATV